MSKLFKLSLLSMSAVLVILIFMGGFGPMGVRAQSAQSEGAYKQMEVYSEVLKRIQSDYVEDPNIHLVTTGALHGLLESLDADSSYLSPGEYKTYKELQKAGTAQVGLIVSKRYGYATVVTVLKGSPAEKAEIEDGDIIEAIGPQTTREMSVATIRGMLEGPPGSTVTFSLVRPRKLEPEKITLTRTIIPTPAFADQEYEQATILYLKPGAITADRVDAIAAKLHAMSGNGNRKVLLDLRDTAQGDNTEAIRLANLFLKSGVIESVEGQKYQKQTFMAEPAKVITAQAPVVVLVNHGTAGPAEVVAAALLDNKRADVVGDRTFGQGSVQKLMELPNGSALILSVAKYYGPNGKAIEDDAVTPNIEVASEQDLLLPDDEGVASQTTEPVKEQSHPDDQLNKALDLLKQKAQVNMPRLSGHGYPANA